ncbi:MAG: hypothetical protein HXY20_12645 [Acidobacteria bacterium]|nr:hypothetical protein [Acidobacteriota bacterium]
MRQFPVFGYHVSRQAIVSLLPALILCVSTIAPPLLHGQGAFTSIISEHVRLRIPAEREWIGRDSIAELQRCYLFIQGVTGKKLPRLVQITVSWEAKESGVSLEDASITIGMNTPVALADSRAYLQYAAIRELARMALLELSEGGAAREENRFILEGMAKILTHEYDRSSRSLNAAWAHCHLMDRIRPLGFAPLASWATFSGGRLDLRTASPGITFLMTCRELNGRDRLLRLFASLREKMLPDGIDDAFRMSAAKLEGAWLDRVRKYAVTEDVTVGPEEDAPRLQYMAMEPGTILPGRWLTVRVQVLDRNNDLLPESVYLEDVQSRRITRGRAAAGAGRIKLELPIETERRPGVYGYRLIAIDEAGNLRNWTGTYNVESTAARE